VTAATANLVGIAVGPLLGGLLAQYGPAPLELPFVAYLVILAVVAMAIVRPAETQERRVARLRELRVRPRIGVPRGRLRSFTAPAVTGFVTFALGGLYFALIPPSSSASCTGRMSPSAASSCSSSARSPRRASCSAAGSRPPPRPGLSPSRPGRGATRPVLGAPRRLGRVACRLRHLRRDPKGARPRSGGPT